MKKFLVLIGIGIFFVIVCLVLITAKNDIISEQSTPIASGSIVVIAMSSSRPGCESTGCYLPTQLSIKSQEAVTWINEDRGFHTVTTGYYDTPDGIIDSDQIAPSDKFHFTFDNPGEFHYYCRLHPWMEGTIIVS
ncbi:MAG: cupredoxin domain-containing protein [Candidatus Nitrosotenuis sp.]